MSPFLLKIFRVSSSVSSIEVAERALELIEAIEKNLQDMHQIRIQRIQTMQADELNDLKEEEVIIHCRSGKRSMMACMFLDSMGFKKTVNVTGGVLAWQEKFGNK